LQHRGVVFEVVFDEALDEPVAVVVTGVATQAQRLAGGGAGGFEAIGLQLRGEEFVCFALVDPQFAVEAMPGGDQGAGIVRGPRGRPSGPTAPARARRWARRRCTIDSGPGA